MSLLCLVGKSCSGKTSIRDRLVKKGFNPIITYTSRPMRKGEVDGKDYYFISEEEFINKIHSDFFAEYKTYNTAHGFWYYGTSRESLINGDNNKVIILTPSGLVDIQDSITIPIFSIYIYANNNTIQTRLENRGDRKDEIVRRIEADNKDFAGVGEKVNKIIYNNLGDSLDEIVEKIERYVKEFESNEI